MATEITEYAGVPMMFGSPVPVRPLGFLRHSAPALGTVVTVGQDTTLLMVTPGEDCRYSANSAATVDPAAPASTAYPLLKAGVRYDFAVTKGDRIRFAAA